MLRDYYGRIIGLPTDHQFQPDFDGPDDDEEEDDDDGDLTRCECVTGCEDDRSIDYLEQSPETGHFPHDA